MELQHCSHQGRRRQIRETLTDDAHTRRPQPTATADSTAVSVTRLRLPRRVARVAGDSAGQQSRHTRGVGRAPDAASWIAPRATRRCARAVHQGAGATTPGVTRTAHVRGCRRSRRPSATASDCWAPSTIWDGRSRSSRPRPWCCRLHSTTLRHPQWGCELDVHDRFPGFLAEPAEVFEALWERRTTARIAHRDVPCPDVVAHGAVAALHWLRDGWAEATQEKLDYLVRALEPRLDDAGRADLVDFVRRTGSAEPLRPFLERLRGRRTGQRARHDLVADPDSVDRGQERGLGGRAAGDAAATAAGSALARAGADRGGDPQASSRTRRPGRGDCSAPGCAACATACETFPERLASSGARGVARERGVAHRPGGRLGRRRGRTGWPSSTSTGSKSRRSC